MQPIDERNAPTRRDDKDPPAAAAIEPGAAIGPAPSLAPRPGPRPGSDLVSEAEAYTTYSHLLEDKELRRARQSGRLGYLRRKRTILYRRDELEAFVRGLVEEGYVPPCREAPSPTRASLPSMARSDARRAAAAPISPELVSALKRRLEERRRSTRKRPE